MKILNTVIAVVLLVGMLPFTANADFDYPRLPWYEKYFFPLGAWISPDLVCIPDSEDPSEPLLPHTWAGPHLPWLESYFFPIGAWCMPTNDNEDRLDYDDGIGKTIAYWDPQDYSKMLDHKLDYGRVALQMSSGTDINYYNIINSIYA